MIERWTGGTVRQARPRLSTSLTQTERVWWAIGVLAGLLGTVAGGRLHAQVVWHGDGLDYRRTVQLPEAGGTTAIVVADFLAHGQMVAAAPRVAVYAGRTAVACRVLQVGPGDYCRVAFQTEKNQSQYQLYYGGAGKSDGKPPDWTSDAGLLLETRRWKACNLNQLPSVRAAFDSAEPIGADFVPQVFHRQNPCAPEPAPFLSRYQGTLRAPLAGKYEFYTSSQDCSFVLIDDKLVVAAPGQHGPVHDARVKGEIELTSGPHRLEYLHAASGEAACMVLAWKIPGIDKPSPLAPDVFLADRVVHLPATRLEHRTQRYLPDFRVAVRGDVPLPDEPLSLLRAQFGDIAAPIVASQAKIHWDFGDGQSAATMGPTHIYLHPGEFQVRCVVNRGGETHEVVNRIVLTHAQVVRDAKQKDDQLDDYLPALRTYVAADLDGLSLLQLVKTYLAGGDAARAAEVGQTAFAPRKTAIDDETAWAIVQLIGPELRDRLAQPAAAAQAWKAAGKTIRRAEWRACCAVAAADVSLHDLQQTDEAGKLVAFALDKLQSGSGDWTSRMFRVLGDWQARLGHGAEARKSYARAEACRQIRRNVTEQNAWRGAHSRSVESFLRDKQLDAARDELRRWELAYPGDKSAGYLPLLWARYWQARGQREQMIATANDGLVVGPSSAYADQLLWMIAAGHKELGRRDAARAAFQSLLTDYPGSPLVEAARQELAGLPAAASGATRESPK